MNVWEIIRIIVVIGATILGMNGYKVFNHHHNAGISTSSTTVCGSGSIANNNAK